jgi:hypothetical protein
MTHRQTKKPFRGSEIEKARTNKKEIREYKNACENVETVKIANAPISQRSVIIARFFP